MSTLRTSFAAAPTRTTARRAFAATATKRPCACGAGFGATYCECGGPVLQRHPATHEVGPVDDPLEREADRAADTVLSGGNVKRIDGRLAGAARVQRSAVYAREPVGSSGRIKTGKLVDWDYVVYADHVRLGNRVFDANTKQVIGSWPWLTNNPGDITVDPKEAGKARSNLNRAYEWGAIAGKAASTGHVPLAIFPDGATGAAALKQLYAEPEYRDKTLQEAIEVHLGRTESRVPGVDDPKKYLDIVKDRARKLGLKDDVLNQTLAELGAAGAMDAIVEGFGAAEGYENPGVTYTCDGRDKTDDAKIPQTVRNLRLFKSLPDQTPDEVLRLLGCKVPSGDGGKAQKKATEPEEAEEDETDGPTAHDASVARALGSSASPLPRAVRQMMETRFGHDFSRVRVHVDATAKASARCVAARAYTVGNDIVFANGEFTPDTRAGQRLLAHELAHVVQQTRPGPVSPTAALENEAHAVGDAVTTGRPVSLANAAAQNSVQRDSEPDGEMQAIAKENGMVAVVIMSGGKIAKGLAEIRPPPGVSAQDAARQIRFARGGPSGKVDVILPPGWGRQTTNPAAKALRVIDTNIEKGEEQAAQVDAQVTELRNNYRQYRNELLIAAGVGPDNSPFSSPDDLNAIAADKGFLEWVQRKQRARDYQDFTAQNQEMGFTAEQTEDAWKVYREPGLEKLQTDIKRLQGLKYRTEEELKSPDPKTESLLFGWLAGNPQPVQIAAGDDKTKVYLFGLPDGDVVSLSEEQFKRLRRVAGDKLETKLNTVQNQKGLYEFHKNDRGAASKALDYVYGADLEGKTWQEIDDSIAASRKALAAGDFDASLKAYGDATKQGYVAQREWERYLHNREVGAEVTITGLEVVKAGAQITIAIGTMQPELAGLSGLAIATGANVGETVVVAAVKSADQHVDWGDVGFEVTAQVVTAAVTHGVAKIAPNSAIMNTIRSGLDTPIVGDAVQAIVVDSATFAVRQEYERARGRGEHLTAAQMKEHFFKFVSDPESMPSQVLEAAITRYLGSRVEAYRASKAQGAAPGASSGEHAPAEAPQGRAAPDRGAAPPADLAAPQGQLHGADTPLPGAPGAEHPAPVSAAAPAPPPASAPPAKAEPRLTIEVAPLQRESGGNAGKPPTDRPAPAAAAAAPSGPAKRPVERMEVVRPEAPAPEGATTPRPESPTAAAKPEHEAAPRAAPREPTPETSPEASGAATANEPVVAMAEGKDHEIEVTAEHIKVCSPKPCPVLHVEYAEELKANPELAKELEAVDALRKAQPKRAAEMAAELQGKLETIREKLSDEQARQSFESSRLAPPLEAPNVGDPRFYSVPQLDAFNRPTYVEAVMTQADLKVGSRGSMPDPAAGTEKGIGYDVTHLGADKLGFPMSVGNLTTASRQTNRFVGPQESRPPTMRRVEIDVQRALEQGQTVHYRVTAIYDGNAPYPSAFHLQASGTKPDGTEGIRFDTVIRNWTHHPQ